jgi:hypothetical protein
MLKGFSTGATYNVHNSPYKRSVSLYLNYFIRPDPVSRLRHYKVFPPVFIMVDFLPRLEYVIEYRIRTVAPGSGCRRVPELE